jgi:hypothetical protein
LKSFAVAGWNCEVKFQLNLTEKVSMWAQFERGKKCNGKRNFCGTSVKKLSVFFVRGRRAYNRPTSIEIS